MIRKRFPPFGQCPDDFGAWLSGMQKRRSGLISPQKKLQLYTMIIATGATVTIPITWSSTNFIHAIGGGQSGQRADSGLGGIGASYAMIKNVAGLIPGNSYNINIATGGTGNQIAGGDSWLENGSGTKILQAIGGGSINSNIGAIHRPGGNPLVPTGGGSLGLQRGGGGGGGAAGPNGPGANSGDIRPGNFATDPYPIYIQTGATDPAICWVFQADANLTEPGAGGGAGNGGQPGGGTAAIAAALQHRINSIAPCIRAGAPPPATYNTLGPVGSEAPLNGTAVLPGDGGDGPNTGDDGGRHWGTALSNDGDGSGGGAGGPTLAGASFAGANGGNSSSSNFIWFDSNGPTPENNFEPGALPGGGGGGNSVGYGWVGTPRGDPGDGGFYGGGGGGGNPDSGNGGDGGQGVLIFQWFAP